MDERFVVTITNGHHMTKQEHHIAFYLSLDEVCDEINSMTVLKELTDVRTASLIDLKPGKDIPRWASQLIRRTVNTRIKTIENLHQLLSINK